MDKWLTDSFASLRRTLSVVVGVLVENIKIGEQI